MTKRTIAIKDQTAFQVLLCVFADLVLPQLLGHVLNHRKGFNRSCSATTSRPSSLPSCEQQSDQQTENLATIAVHRGKPSTFTFTASAGLLLSWELHLAVLHVSHRNSQVTSSLAVLRSLCHNSQHGVVSPVESAMHECQHEPSERRGLSGPR